MHGDLRDFWRRLQTGVEVAVAVPTPEKLLGVRDGFVRYFQEGLQQAPSVAVVPQPVASEGLGLPPSDEEVMALAQDQVRALAASVGDAYHFLVASEGGLDAVEVGGRLLYFVRNWTLVRSPVGEAWGASGSVQLPERLVGGGDGAGLPATVPGTRRAGGLMASLTGGLETRRRATALSTLNALSTLFYGIFERRPARWPG
jgi:non-canonical (house-cleaning) NTP pyrophosphatase